MTKPSNRQRFVDDAEQAPPPRAAARRAPPAKVKPRVNMHPEEEEVRHDVQVPPAPRPKAQTRPQPKAVARNAPPPRRAPPAPAPRPQARPPQRRPVVQQEDYYEDEPQEEENIQVTPRIQRREDPREPSRSETRRGVVRRRRRGTQEEDPFYIPDELKPEDMSLEWKRDTFGGKEEDPDYMVGLEQQGWETVSLKAYPQFRRLVPTTWTHDYIKRKGLILMIRPMELTEEAMIEDEQVARQDLRDGLRQAADPDGYSLPRHNKGKPITQIRRTVERGTRKVSRHVDD